MLSLISFILVSIGCLNWFSIGLLQYDFVAGIFGSQSNIFSRLIYALVGIASIIVIANLIANKGKFVISFKDKNKEYDKYQEEHANLDKKPAYSVESSKDNSLENKSSSNLGASYHEHKTDFHNHNNENNKK